MMLPFPRTQESPVHQTSIQVWTGAQEEISSCQSQFYDQRRMLGRYFEQPLVNRIDVMPQLGADVVTFLPFLNASWRRLINGDAMIDATRQGI
jgi:hypothetical protein